MELIKNEISTDDFEAQIVTLVLDDSSELDCAVIAVFDGVDGYEDILYSALLPIDEEEREDGELFLYRYTELPNDELDIQAIEDDDEFSLVAERFDALLEEQGIEAFDVQL